MPAEWRGTIFARPGDFPLLAKFIFPTDKLSIQVHPDDAYAAAHEKAAGGHGKTEMCTSSRQSLMRLFCLPQARLNKRVLSGRPGKANS